MRLQRIPHDPAGLIDFFQEGLESLGALAERSWHDRLELVAEGRAARLWNLDGALLETEIHFTAPETSGPRNAQTEVFPGCPLTFHLAEALRPACLQLERAVLQPDQNSRPPTSDAAERIWRSQMPGTIRWKLGAPPTPDWHFSLVALVRSEIQAIDQHWSLHRLAISLPDGTLDESLAGKLDFAQFGAEPIGGLAWPKLSPESLLQLLRSALGGALDGDLAVIRRRQENYLRREIERIDAYFESYERELNERMGRSRLESAKSKLMDRLKAAQTERESRRIDQVQRHEIRVIPHLDAVMIFAEPAWRAHVSYVRQGENCSQAALFVPRSRRWVFGSEKVGN
ncbi:MAG: hypothetical protein O2960_24165 [Verrucomicrobia bacterium]|nr:hypothetical protein [Verrucomicrobiota bacterium]